MLISTNPITYPCEMIPFISTNILSFLFKNVKIYFERITERGKSREWKRELPSLNAYKKQCWVKQKPGATATSKSAVRMTGTQISGPSSVAH